MALISDEYRMLLGEMHHKHIEFGIGAGAKAHVQVERLMSKYDTQSVLDYGCGKGTLTHFIPVIVGYDPALIEFCKPPKPADLVICRDVMEHVEDDCIDDVLDHIKSLARKAAWFVIACRLATKKLPDGRNTHISVHPVEWWRGKLEKRFKIVHEDTSKPGEYFVTVEPCA